jgi:hypothetical protein
VDALVVGEKSEAEVQESIRRWWDLIHPADRQVAQKYLLAVLERSSSALEAIGDGLCAGGFETVYSPQPSKRLKIMDRIVKETTVRTAV